jgi:hypothetical protein
MLSLPDCCIGEWEKCIFHFDESGRLLCAMDLEACQIEVDRHVDMVFAEMVSRRVREEQQQHDSTQGELFGYAFHCFH